MTDLLPRCAIAVMFISGRAGTDVAGYRAAATATEAAAVRHDGFLGMGSTRNNAAIGITISRWRDEAAAIAWRQDPEPTRIREQGRTLWYDWYRVVVAVVERRDDWQRCHP
jgi:heme-degrading monooxygenase HmoA